MMARREPHGSPPTKARSDLRSRMPRTRPTANGRYGANHAWRAGGGSEARYRARGRPPAVDSQADQPHAWVEGSCGPRRLPSPSTDRQQGGAKRHSRYSSGEAALPPDTLPECSRPSIIRALGFARDRGAAFEQTGHIASRHGGGLRFQCTIMALAWRGLSARRNAESACPPR